MTYVGHVRTWPPVRCILFCRKYSCSASTEQFWISATLLMRSPTSAVLYSIKRVIFKYIFGQPQIEVLYFSVVSVGNFGFLFYHCLLSLITGWLQEPDASIENDRPVLNRCQKSFRFHSSSYASQTFRPDCKCSTWSCAHRIVFVSPGHRTSFLSKSAVRAPCLICDYF